MTSSDITATSAFYIKLGQRNRWAQHSFETGRVCFGFRDISHEQAVKAAQADDFTSVKDWYQKRGCSAGVATRYSNEIRKFYTAGADVLWITFVKGRMWWCFADTEVIPNQDVDPEASGSRYRNTIREWSDKDVSGRTLSISTLRGSLTTTVGFRGTIAGVKEFDYLLRRLNGKETAITQAVRDARSTLVTTLIPLIRGLHWGDFELLVELVMTQGGWRRVSATGETQHTIDLALELPLTRERALVQVKSRLNQEMAQEIAGDLTEAGGGGRVFLVYHTGPDQLSIDGENVTVIGPEALAEHVVDVGLTAWVMSKVG